MALEVPHRMCLYGNPPHTGKLRGEYEWRVRVAEAGGDVKVVYFTANWVLHTRRWDAKGLALEVSQKLREAGVPLATRALGGKSHALGRQGEAPGGGSGRQLRA